ncbi:hypothetical protein [Ornithinicoccus halotolerans]|uniref:hypothetical protein n=1 Tax=Ornithinicoccus halotolerans TaxID=1748220 RepID=UPI0012955E9C|nr:hypothetical protein [Ornithinicoccus halotolerans]
MPEVRRPLLEGLDRLRPRPPWTTIRDRIVPRSPAAATENAGPTPVARLTTVILYDRHRAWTRLQELHDRAVNTPDWQPRVVDQALSVDKAAGAHARSVGAALASFALSSDTRRQELTHSLSEYLREVGSTAGLEGPILTALTATIESRRSGYDRLVETVSSLGFDKGLGAGAGGAPLLDVRDHSIGFVGESTLMSGFAAIEAIIGRPGDEGPPFRQGSGRSNDPTLVGMDPDLGEQAIRAAARGIGTGVGALQSVLRGGLEATQGTAGETNTWMALAVLASIDAEAMASDAMFAYFYDADDGGGGRVKDTDAEERGEDTTDEPASQDEEPKPDPSGDDNGDDDGDDDGREDQDEDTDAEERGEEPVWEEGEETMPDPSKDDGAPVMDIRYVQQLIDAHSPRFVNDGSGRSFWASGDLLIKPGDLVTDPPPESATWSLEQPIDLDALLMSRKRPINPKSVANYGDGASVAGVLAVEDAPASPLLASKDGSVRLPW